MDTDTHKANVIVNNPEELKAFYENNKCNIWCGYNSRGYGQYILKGILCDFNPKEVNDWMIFEITIPDTLKIESKYQIYSWLV